MNPVNAAINLDLQEVETRLQEAELYYSQGLIEEAAGIYTSVLEQDLLDPDLRTKIEKRLAAIQGAEKNGGQSVHQTGSSSAKDPESLYHNSLGLIEAGFHKEALEELKDLAEQKWKPGKVHTKIAECYLALDTPFEAADHFKAALDDPSLEDSERLDILYQLALTQEQIGAIPDAIDALEQIATIDPNFRNASARLEELSQSAQRYGRFYYLIRTEKLTENQLDEARELAKRDKKTIESILLNHFGIKKPDLGRSLSEYYRCPFVEFNELEAGTTPSCIQGIKEHFFRNTVCAPIREHAGTIIVALDNPNDLRKIDDIRRVLKANSFEFAVALKEDIEKFIDYFYGKYSLGDSDEDVFDQLELVDDEDMDEEEEGLASDADNIVVQIANKIIDDAYRKNASDIHLESLTGKRGVQVRYRIDGDCLRYQTIPYNYKKALVSRIKIMANLDIAEKRLPQDGKIKFRMRSGKTIELRVATLPTTENNEDVVLRILASSEAMPLDKIGLLDHNLSTFKQLLEMPYGLILVVGPTGSGKTTSLHAALGYINRPEKKIWTAEDPVEIVQDGLRQVQVRPGIGLTFAKVLRAFLRADPDVIMVGETRDEETAETVIEASLTGHLVFSTLHTNSAPETVTRLLGIGMDPFNFADALLGVLAQRLVKRLCPNCKEQYEPDDEEKEQLIKEFGEHPARPLTMEDIEKGTFFKPKGCLACNETGYKGRMAIHELLTSDDNMRKLIQHKSPVGDIREHAMRAGMLTLKQDGILKVLMGETDLKQVRAACIK